MLLTGRKDEGIYRSIAEVAEQYNPNLDMLLSDLETAARFCKSGVENSF